MNITHNEVSFPVELALLIVKKYKIDDAFHLLCKFVKNFFSAAEIIEVSEMNSEGLIAWVGIQDFNIGCNSGELLNMCSFFFIFEVIGGSSKLSLILVLIIGAF